MHNFHYHRFIYTGVKKQQAFLYGEVCRKLKVTSPPPWGPSSRLPVREAQVYVLLLSQSESTTAAQCKRNHSRRRSFHPMTAAERGSVQWERPSHSCYGKCSLAVIPLVTGRSSPVSLLDRKRRWGGTGGDGQGGGPSGCQFITTMVCSHATKKKKNLALTHKTPLMSKKNEAIVWGRLWASYSPMS